MQAFAIIPARTPADLDAVAALFRAYQAAVNADICFQGFESELASLPGAYAPPRGALLLARDASGKAVGCVAMQPHRRGDAAEMKRLFVAPEARSQALGRQLAETIVKAARGAAYPEVVLETLPDMVAAHGLYRSMGFVAVEPETGIGDTGILQMRLRFAT